MHKAISAREYIRTNPDEGVVLAGDDDRPCVKAEMADDPFRDRDAICIGELLGGDWGDMHNKAFGRIAGGEHKAWPRFAPVFSTGLGFMAPEVAVMDDVARDRSSP
jgi:hypothetical protein